jgi:cytochrome c-type biogenesis protein
MVARWCRSTAAILLYCSFSAACGGDVPAVEVGRAAPAYAAVTLEGEDVSLERLRGKPVLLNVWATWCAPCREEIPYLSRLFAEHRDEGLEIIGVSIDARGEDEKIAEFAKDIGMRYPVWLDPDQRVAATFLAFGVPASYLVDRHGVLRWKHVGVLRPTNTVFTAALEGVLKDRPAP